MRRRGTGERSISQPANRARYVPSSLKYRENTVTIVTTVTSTVTGEYIVYQWVGGMGDDGDDGDGIIPILEGGRDIPCSVGWLWYTALTSAESSHAKEPP